MSNWRNPPARRHDVVTIPNLWVAVALSLLLHLAALWLLLPRMHDLSLSAAQAGKAVSALAVQLAPAQRSSPQPPVAPATAAAPVPPPPAASAPPSPKRRAAAPPREAKQRAPVIALERQRPDALPPPASPPLEAPTPTRPSVDARPPARPSLDLPPPPAVAERAPAAGSAPLESDLTSYIETRRRERGEPMASAGQETKASPPTAEDDIERRNRIVAANLGTNRTPSFGYDPKNAGGIFQITHMGYDYAEFYFFGLNKAIGRNTKQLIEVRKGADSDIRVAVVHRMIAIIRENVSGDFVWLSQRGPITMSARPSDNAALEDLITREVFPDTRPLR